MIYVVGYFVIGVIVASLAALYVLKVEKKSVLVYEFLLWNIFWCPAIIVLLIFVTIPILYKFFTKPLFKPKE